ncbi:MAG: condensation domain-containing protein, partial [Psychrosphaera sp.]|nr:condensation domain-containing protein [Psychrosphaera sp.]
TLRQQLMVLLPDYMLPAIFVELKQLPLTPNGKIDKKQLPGVDDRFEVTQYSEPTTPVEHQLVEVWAQVLGYDSDKLSVQGNFFELGGDSILSIQLVSRARLAGLHFSVKQLFDHQTIRQLGLQLNQQAAVEVSQAAVAGQQQLLPIQQAFFADDREHHHFNQSLLLSTPASFDVEDLTAIVEQLYLRHDALRLCFEQTDGQWQGQYRPFDSNMLAQSIDAVVLEGHDYSAIDAVANRLQRSFSLDKGPLFKALLITNESDQHNTQTGRLLLVAHHLVVDGVSWRILMGDLEQLLTDKQHGNPLSLPAKTAAYQDWAKQLQTYAASSTLLEERSYWLDVLASTEKLSLISQTGVDDGVIDSDDGVIKSGAAEVDFSLDKVMTRQLLQQAGKAYRCKINELLLASVLLGFNRWSGQTGLTVDLEGHGRETLNWPQGEGQQPLVLDQTVGWFTSVYPLTLKTDQADIRSIICAVKEQYR